MVATVDIKTFLNIRPIRIKFPILFIFIIGIIATVLLYFIVKGLEEERVKNRFNIISSKTITAVKEGVGDKLSFFNYITLFFKATDVNKKQFKKFAEPLVKTYPSVELIGWIPYEKNKGFFIKIKDGQFYDEANPFMKNNEIIGLDLELDLIINTMIKGNAKQKTASPPVFFKNIDKPSLLVVAPILEGEINKGFIIMSFNIKDIVENAIADIISNEINLEIVDITHSKNKKVYNHKSNQEKKEVLSLLKEKLFFSNTIKVANRTWKIEAKASKSYSINQRNYSIIVLILGCIGTLILSHYSSLFIKYYETARQETEQKLQFILENVPDSIMEIDGLGNVLFANHIISNMMKDEIIGKSIFEYLPEDEKFALATALEKAKAIGETQNYETSMNVSDELSYFYSRVISVKSDDKNTFLIISTDITERKREREKLKQRGKQLRQIIDLVPHMIFARDKDGFYRMVNDTAASTYGLDIEKMTGMNYKNIPNNEERYEKVIAEDMEVISTGKNKYITESYKYNGKKKTLEVVKMPYEISEGEVAVLCVAVDITDLRNAEAKLEKIVEELRQREKQLRQIIDLVPHMIFARDKDGFYRMVNKAAADGYGLNIDEMTGMHYKDIPNNKERYKRVIKEDKEVLATMKSKSITEDYNTYQGEVKTVKTIKIPYELDEKETAILGISVDITDTIKAKTQLEEMIEELTRSNAELERFAYVASHDLQEPLRTIHIYTQLLEEQNKDKFDEESRQYVEYIKNDVTHVSLLVKALLTYSRMNNSGVENENINCNDVLKYVLSTVGFAIEDANAVITKDDLPIISAKRIFITQLFNNLVGNALKYVKKEEETIPKIHIGVLKKGEFWEFFVKDNGIGIEKEYYEKIFEAFNKIHSRDEYSGNGIGLAICKKAVANLGGDIRVESEVGKGTTFYFTVPAELVV